jgi:hypothetical protein
MKTSPGFKVESARTSSGVNSQHGVSLPVSIQTHPILQLQRLYGNRWVQRFLAVEKQSDATETVTPEVEGALNRARGSGQSLEEGVQRQMESVFGTDFSHVRVHTNAEADALNRSVNALAFTIGSDVFFRNGMHCPSSTSGRELLAHELTHVVQQTGASVQTKLAVGPPDDEFEKEADRVAHAVVAAESASPVQRYRASGESTIQRQETSNPEDMEDQLRQQGLIQAKRAGTGVVQRVNIDAGINRMLIQRRGGATAGQLSVNTNVIGAGLTAGHAWLAYTPGGGTMTTYGTWGNRTPIGLYRDLELGYPPAASRTTDLDATDYSALASFAAANDDWGYINNCASFAARGWLAVTSESLSYTSLGIPNPSALGNGIVAANGGTAGVLPAAPAAPAPPSSSSL